MRLIIAGGRDYRLTKEDQERLSALVTTLADGFSARVYQGTLIITGGYGRADRDAHQWALNANIQTAVFAPNWKQRGPGAGPFRNGWMASCADAVVLFPGGRGTQSMHDEAVKAGLRVFDWRENG